MKNVIITAVSLAMIIVGLSGCNKAQKSIVDASIFFYVGNVTVNGTAVTAAGQKIKYGDIIKTGKKAICKIKIEDKTMIQLNKNSELVYKISKDNSVLKLNKGWFAGITRKAFTLSKKYTIETPTVTAAVRGTSYCIKIENANSSYFCVCNGTINLSGKGRSDGEDVKAAHHKAKRFKKDNKGTIIVENAKMLYHGDAVIENLAKEIGEKVNWTKAH